MWSKMTVSYLLDERNVSKLFFYNHGVAEIFSGMTYTSLKGWKDGRLMHHIKLYMSERFYTDRTSISFKKPSLSHDYKVHVCWIHVLTMTVTE